MSDLARRRCVPCHGGATALHPDALPSLLVQVPLWTIRPDGKEIERTYRFANFHEGMAFVNAVAWVAHTEDHHPDMGVHYDRVVVRFSTHAVGGLTDSDFICAAKVDALLPPAE